MFIKSCFDHESSCYGNLKSALFCHGVTSRPHSLFGSRLLRQSLNHAPRQYRQLRRLSLSILSMLALSIQLNYLHSNLILFVQRNAMHQAPLPSSSYLIHFTYKSYFAVYRFNCSSFNPSTVIWRLLIHSPLLQLDFWTYPSKIGEPVDIHVTHRWAREFKHFLARRTISFRVKIRNLQRLINGERMRARSGVPFNGAFRSYSQVSLNNAVCSILWKSMIKRHCNGVPSYFLRANVSQ